MHKKRNTMNIILMTALASMLFAACSSSSSRYGDGIYAKLETNKGLIVLQLEFEKTPVTTANFVGLAEGRIVNDALPSGEPYFTGTVFHRVVPGHVIQAGAPDVEGKSSPGYTIPNEIHPDLGHGRPGMLGMANGGPHTNGSQFYITLDDRSYLDGDYTVFGSVIQGMVVVFAIEQGDVIRSVTIVRAGKKARAFRPDEATFRAMVTAAEARVKQEEAQKKREEEKLIQSRWPEAVITESGLRHLVLRAGSGPRPSPDAKLELTYTGQTLEGIFFSSSGDGSPHPGNEASPFVYEPGVTPLIPALRDTVEDLNLGEQRLLIVPASQAYGIRGYYAPEIKGEPRFVISPNTTLVFEITLRRIL
jgi:cyclophilin family peptidyl-prolyl cis-trans isomerase